MPTCFMCDKDVNNNEVVKCSSCKNVFHAACTRLENIEKFKKKNTESKAAWKCDDCVGVNKGEASLDSKINKVLELITTLRADFTQQTSLITAKVEELSKQVEAVKITTDETKFRLDELSKENKEIIQTCEQLKHRNAELTTAVSQLEDEVHSLQQQSRLENIEIVGIPATNGEDLYNVLNSVAQAIGIDFKPYDISATHRVPNSRKTTSIVVKFVSRKVKMDWITAAKKKRSLKISDITPNLKEGDVFINDHLSPYYKVLLGLAKSLKKDNKLAYVWVREGKILIRESATSPVKRIFKKDNLDKYM